MSIFKTIPSLKHLSTLLFLFSCLSTLYAQPDKGEYISEFSTFMDTVKANKESYTTEEWVVNDTLFTHFSDNEYDKYEKEFSDMEKKQLNEFIGKYVAYRAPSAAQELVDATAQKLRNAGSFSKGLWDGVTESTTDSTETE